MRGRSRISAIPLAVPRLGTNSTTAWYKQYHGLVRIVPRLGTACLSAFHGLAGVPPDDVWCVGFSAALRMTRGLLRLHSHKSHPTILGKTLLHTSAPHIMQYPIRLRSNANATPISHVERSETSRLYTCGILRFALNDAWCGILRFALNDAWRVRDSSLRSECRGGVCGILRFALNDVWCAWDSSLRSE